MLSDEPLVLCWLQKHCPCILRLHLCWCSVEGRSNNELRKICCSSCVSATVQHLVAVDRTLSICVGDNLDLILDFLTNGLQTIRIFDPFMETYQVVAEMERGRWYPSINVLADGNVLIVGGMQQVSMKSFCRPAVGLLDTSMHT